MVPGVSSFRSWTNGDRHSYSLWLKPVKAMLF